MKARTRTLEVILLLTVVSLGAPTAAQSEPACPTPGWSVAATPNKGSGDNSLRSVAAVSATDAWAVGAFSDPRSQQSRPLVLHWNGRAWETVRAARRAVGSLQGVDATAAGEGWAVGSKLTEQFGSRAMALHWDGTAWDPKHVPAPLPGANTVLADVEVLGPEDAWAVGYWSPGGEAPPRPLIEHWDGDAWKVVASPELDSWSELQGVSATSPSDVWAVGNVEVTVGSDLVERALIERWDGKAWTLARTPFLGQRIPFALEAVGARAPDDAWAAGEMTTRSGVLGIAFHWDGIRWRSDPPLNPSHRFQLMAGIAVAARHRVVVVGTFWDAGERDYRSHVERWNGRRWQQAPSGNRQADNELLDVAVLPSAQFAVGSFWAHGGEGPERALVLRRCAA